MALELHLPKTVLTSLIALVLAQPLVAQTDGAALRDLSGHKVEDAQLRSAVASRVLTWLTGTSANNDYISVGRMANFFGFVALRVSSGQSLTRAHVARDTLAVLKPSQIDIIVALIDEQSAPHANTQAVRVEMNRALERLLVGEEIAQDDFLRLGEFYGAAEAELGRVIAQRFGELSDSLTPEQRGGLTTIRAAHAAGQPDTIPAPKHRVRLPDVDRQELVNLAARFLSWTTGSPKLNDFEVVGKPSQHFGFVSLRLASGHSLRRGAVAREILDMLSTDQRQMLDMAVQQNAELFPAFLAMRAKLMRELEVALKGDVIDRETIRRLGEDVGKIEAKMTWAQATSMLNVRDALSAEQLEALLAMRAKYSVAETRTSLRDPLDHGRQLFAQCVLCHASSRDDAVAPNLAGIVGRDIAADADYRLYSPALRRFAQSEGSWTTDLLDAFLQSPRGLVPGTTMSFDGIDAADDRAAVLDYLATFD